MSYTKDLLKWCLRRRKFKSLLLLTGFILIIYLILPGFYLSYVYFIGQNITDFELQGEKSVSLRKSDKTGGVLEKIVHLDFKGAPPKTEYILRLIPLFKEMGATGILIEYEDMFPYHDGLEGIPALNAYSRSDVRAIVKAAESHNLTIVPLIPTLSHLEFVLKLEQYQSFREIDNNPETICPSRSGIYKILQKMIDQLLEVHEKSKYLHIGCDETTLLGICSTCKSLMKEKNLRKEDIYLRHIRRVAEYVARYHPGVRAIIWGNGLSKYERSNLLRNRIPHLVDVVLFNYKIDYDSFPSPLEMQFLARIFSKIWIAGSFKGVAGSSQIVTDIDYHSVNFRLWMDFMEQWKPTIEFKGVILIGSQRYTHFDVLCELLPVAIPSLAVTLRSIQDVIEFDYDLIKSSLSCNDFVPTNAKDFMNMEQLAALRCEFPGFEVYRIIHYFFKAVLVTKELLINPNTEELSFYNVLHSEWRPSHVSILSTNKYKDQLLTIIKFERAIKIALLKIYDKYTVGEWIATNVFPIRLHLQTAVTVVDPLIKKKVWPRRPLMNDISHFQAVFNTLCRENKTLGCSFLFTKFTKLI